MWESFKSDLAVDGNTNTQFLISNTCSHTGSGDMNPWWVVDLGQMFDIQGVILFNRGDCCGKMTLNSTIQCKSSCQ